LIKFFLEKEAVSKSLIDVLYQKIISPIELIYFSSSKNKKMLMDLGVYERDVDKVIKIIGDDFEDTLELKKRLSANVNKLSNMSFITKYVIRNLM
jgi:hypothetical protein